MKRYTGHGIEDGRLLHLCLVKKFRVKEKNPKPAARNQKLNQSFFLRQECHRAREMVQKEEELGFMVKNGIGDKKNYPKYDSYRLAFGMIDDALKCGCPLQAITIEESILTDRLSSTLNVGISKGKPYKTLGSALNAWRPKNKNKQPHSNAKLFDLEMNNLYERLDKWREARNNLLHGLVKSFQGEGPETPAGDFIKTATEQAEEGLYLVEKVKNWVQKQVCNAKKAKVK